MAKEKSELHCLNCGKSENEAPLLHLNYIKEELWICTKCLPTLVHMPQKLTGKIKNAEQIEPG